MSTPRRAQAWSAPFLLLVLLGTGGCRGAAAKLPDGDPERVVFGLDYVGQEANLEVVFRDPEFIRRAILEPMRAAVRDRHPAAYASVGYLRLVDASGQPVWVAVFRPWGHYKLLRGRLPRTEPAHPGRRGERRVGARTGKEARGTPGEALTLNLRRPWAPSTRRTRRSVGYRSLATPLPTRYDLEGLSARRIEGRTMETGVDHWAFVLLGVSLFIGMWAVAVRETRNQYRQPPWVRIVLLSHVLGVLCLAVLLPFFWLLAALHGVSLAELLQDYFEPARPRWPYACLWLVLSLSWLVGVLLLDRASRERG